PAMQPSASRPNALCVSPCCSPSAAPCCSPSVAPCCSQHVAPCCSARRALLQPTRRALLPRASRSATARASRPAALHSACPAARAAQAEPRRPARATLPNPSRPAATTAAAVAAARATAAAGGGALGSAGGAAGAGGGGGAARSTRGAAGAGGAGPTTGRHCLSWQLSRQLQQPGLDSSGHCLSRTTPPLSSFVSGLFSKAVLVVEAAALGPIESAAAPGAGEYAVALGARDSADALGATASTATCPPSAEALHTFTLDSSASRCFFRDCTTLTPLAAQVPVSLADPTGGPVAEAGQVAASSRVSASGQLAASCSYRVLSHQTLLWHHRLGHPSLPRLHSMHSCLLVSGLPRSLPSLPRSPAPPCLPCVEGRQRVAPHSSEFPPTIAPLQTHHMDVWGPTPVGGADQERYFLLVVDDYTCYTTVFTLRRKPEFSGILIPWIRATRRQLRERFRRDFPNLHLHSDRGSEFSSDLLAEFCRDEGIPHLFTLTASPQQNGIAERRIGLIMEVAHTSMIHAAAPHFLWPFAVRQAAHQLNLWPRGALSVVRDAKASKLSSHTLHCVFRGFPTDAPPWQFYHPRSRRVFSSQDVTFDESVCFYRLHPHASHPGPAPSGVSQVDSPPLVEPLEISSDSSGLAEGDNPAADDTAATLRSPRLETLLGFPPRPSSPPPQRAAMDYGAETASAKPGGAET
ncbi:unnamed protein product, partial [Closterium sp. NIES-53]